MTKEEQPLTETGNPFVDTVGENNIDPALHRAGQLTIDQHGFGAWQAQNRKARRTFWSHVYRIWRRRTRRERHG